MAITKIQSESLNLSDTYDFTGTVTGAGESNTPFFFAKSLTSSLSMSHETWTVQTNWNTPTKSTQGTLSSGIYTPGIAGKYVFYMVADIGNMGDADRCFCRLEASEDGSTWSSISASGKDMCSSGNADIAPQTSAIHTCTTSTQIRALAWHEFGSARNWQGGYFSGYLLTT